MPARLSVAELLAFIGNPSHSRFAIETMVTLQAISNVITIFTGQKLSLLIKKLPNGDTLSSHYEEILCVLQRYRMPVSHIVSQTYPSLCRHVRPLFSSDVSFKLLLHLC